MAIVTWATTDRQSTIRLTLADLGDEPVRNPAVIVVGAVAGLDLTSMLDPVISPERTLVPTP